MVEPGPGHRRLGVYLVECSRPLTHLQDVRRDQLPDRPDVNLAFEVQVNLSEAGEPEFQLGVEIEPSCGLDAPGLNLDGGPTRRSVDLVIDCCVRTASPTRPARSGAHSPTVVVGRVACVVLRHPKWQAAARPTRRVRCWSARRRCAERNRPRTLFSGAPRASISLPV